MIKLDHISKKYGSTEIFTDFSLEFEENGITCLLGASGVGKTTLLSMLAGLVKPDEGSVTVRSTDGKKLCSSYVFQEPRLLPWLSVHDNLDFVLRNVRDDNGRRLYSKEERSAMIRKQLGLVGLETHEFSKLTELSGGMLQRAALSRAFIYPADLIFLDEPFKEQDPRRKEELYKLFLQVYQNIGGHRTVIFVTHDIPEALELADHICVLSGQPAKISGSFHRNEFDSETAAIIRELI